jgi:hypothetical protein
MYLFPGRFPSPCSPITGHSVAVVSEASLPDTRGASALRLMHPTNRLPCLLAKPDVRPQGWTETLSSLTNSRNRAELSCQVRAVTMFPHTTTC